MAAPGGCILQLPTGTGKTWLALQEIKRTLANGYRAIYVTPLRAQAEELSREWTNQLSEYTVGVFTGEYGKADRQYPVPFGDAQLMIMTPERLDACTRFWRSHWNWIPEVDLLVVDEIHLISDPRRGPKLECAISRLRRLNPLTRILGLSATLGNRSDLADWIGGTEYSTNHRPIPLYWQQVTYKSPQDKLSHLEAKLRELCGADAQALVFVQSRRRAEQIAKQLDSASVCAAHHHAGLNHDARKVVESLFRNHQLQVLVCTPTLEMGVNLPARYVFLYDLQKYDGKHFVPLSVNQVWQRAGRAGRPGHDIEGTAVLFSPSWDKASRRYEQGNFEPIESCLDNLGSVAEQIVCEVASGLCHSRVQVIRAFDGTLASLKERLKNLDSALNAMLEAGMLSEHPCEGDQSQQARLKATRLGRVAVRHMISPTTVLMFRRVFNEPLQLSFFDLLFIIASTDEQEPLIPVEFERLNQLNRCIKRSRSDLLSMPHKDLCRVLHIDGKRLLTAIHTAHVLDLWTELGDGARVAQYTGCYEFEIERLRDCTLRNLGALLNVYSVMFPKPDDEENPAPTDLLPMREKIAALSFMIQSGLPSNAASLSSIKGIGPVLARRIFEFGVTDIEDLANSSSSELSTIPGISVERASRWIDAAGALTSIRPNYLYHEYRALLELTSVTARSVDKYRLRRAQELSVTPLSATVFKITGGTDPHLIKVVAGSLICDCRDFEKGNHCKHRIAVESHVSCREGVTLNGGPSKHADSPIDVYQLWGEAPLHKVEEPRVAA